MFTIIGNEIPQLSCLADTLRFVVIFKMLMFLCFLFSMTNHSIGYLYGTMQMLRRYS